MELEEVSNKGSWLLNHQCTATSSSIHCSLHLILDSPFSENTVTLSVMNLAAWPCCRDTDQSIKTKDRGVLNQSRCHFPARFRSPEGNIPVAWLLELQLRN